MYLGVCGVVGEEGLGECCCGLCLDNGVVALVFEGAGFLPGDFLMVW